MTHTIAIAGKGGVGKTTITGLIIKYLSKNNKNTILAVDADANSNLNEVLGIKFKTTLGNLREKVSNAEISNKNPIPINMTKSDYIEFKFDDILVENNNYDLLVMGRSQGKGCYCYVNNILREQLIKIQNNYSYIIVDNEAGMEHISRGILPNIQTVILVSDCSIRGIKTAARIKKLIYECKFHPNKIYLIVNKVQNGILNFNIKKEIKKYNFNFFNIIPHSKDIYDFDCKGLPIVNISEKSIIKKSIKNIINDLKL